MKAKYRLKFFKLVLWDEGVWRKIVNILLPVLTIGAIIFTDVEEWRYWLLALLVLPVAWWYFTFDWAFKRWRNEVSQDWIEAYKLEHGELPALPEYLLELVNNYTLGEPVHKDIKVKIASVQYWRRLKPSQKEKFLELVDWLGLDRRDYLAEMESRRPPGGGKFRLYHKR